MPGVDLVSSAQFVYLHRIRVELEQATYCTKIGQIWQCQMLKDVPHAQVGQLNDAWWVHAALRWLPNRHPVQRRDTLRCLTDHRCTPSNF